ncbi:MAG: hypothetical protein AAF288_03355 [Planctomycetota bacterium]
MPNAERSLFPDLSYDAPLGDLPASAAAATDPAVSAEALAAMAEAEGVPTQLDLSAALAERKQELAERASSDPLAVLRERAEASDPVQALTPTAAQADAASQASATARPERPAVTPATNADPDDTADTTALSKRELINRIRVRNRTAAPEFLANFDEPALREYLERLTGVLGQRGRGSVWVRPAGRPAVSWPKPVNDHARRAG